MMRAPLRAACRRRCAGVTYHIKIIQRYPPCCCCVYKEASRENRIIHTRILQMFHSCCAQRRQKIIHIIHPTTREVKRWGSSSSEKARARRQAATWRMTISRAACRLRRPPCMRGICAIAVSAARDKAAVLTPRQQSAPAACLFTRAAGAARVAASAQANQPRQPGSAAP